MLKNVLDHEERAVTIEMIQKFVADYYQLKLADLKSRTTRNRSRMPRQIAMYLCKSLTHASLPEIGRSFGGKHHSTVIHSIRKVEELCAKRRRRFQQPHQQLDRVVSAEEPRRAPRVFHSVRAPRLSDACGDRRRGVRAGSLEAVSASDRFCTTLSH